MAHKGLATFRQTVQSDSSARRFQAIATQYLKERQEHVSRETYIREAKIISVNLEPYFGKNTSLVKIQRSDVLGYLEHRGRKISPLSLMKELNVLKHLFSAAVESGYISASPVHTIKAPSSSTRRVRHLQPAEFLRVLDSSPEWLKPIVQFSFATGLRRNEVLSVQWANINIEQLRMLYPLHKNSKQSWTMPLNRLAQSALAAVRRERSGSSEKVFTARSATPMNVTQAFRRACQTAGIRNFSYQDLRGTAAHWMTTNNINPQTVSRFLRRKNIHWPTNLEPLTDASLAYAVSVLDSTLEFRASKRDIKGPAPAAQVMRR